MNHLAKVQEILEQNIYCTVSTVCDDGKPWGSPVFFGFDNDRTIYWRSWTENVHSRNLQARSGAFVTIFDSHTPWGEGTGVYMLGKAHQLDDVAEIDKALSCMNLRSKKSSEVEEFLAPNPRRMYAFTPEKTWVNIDKEKDGRYIDERVEASS